MNLKLLIILFSLINLNSNTDSSKTLQGAWKSDNGVLILAENYFSFASFSATEFHDTYGGSWKPDGERIVL